MIRAKTLSIQNKTNLIVSFSNGIIKQFDVSTLFEEIPIFRNLSNFNLFKKARLDKLGLGIIWNDNIDLAIEHIYEYGKEIKTPYSNLIAFVDATELWNLNESTLRKAVQYKRFIIGIDVFKFGKQWVITREAMEREYGEMPK